MQTKKIRVMPSITPSAGLDIQALISAIATADEIVLHAAIYNNFAGSDIHQQLVEQLSSNELKMLTIISIQPQDCWRNEFTQVLRSGFSDAQMSAVYARSRKWCQELALAFPDQVILVLTNRLPMQPILLLDDTIFAGQYSHSPEPSALGLWLHIDTEAFLPAGTIMQWFRQSGSKSKEIHSPWHQALRRYVDECAQARLCSIVENSPLSGPTTGFDGESDDN